MIYIGNLGSIQWTGDQEVADVFVAYYPMLTKVLCLYVIVLIAVIVDLWSGIRKSRIKGVGPHSYGLRRTITKISRYLNILLMSTLIDGILILADIHAFRIVPFIPIVTTIFAFILCCIEMYSVFERDEDKGRYVEGAKILSEVLNMSSTKDLTKLIDLLDSTNKQQQIKMALETKIKNRKRLEDIKRECEERDSI